MKKTFNLTNTNKPQERHIESIKSEIKKYIARERRKKLPDEETDYWFFDCKFGTTAEDAQPLFTNEIKAKVDEFVKLEKTSFYLEILSKVEKKETKKKEKKFEEKTEKKEEE